MNKEFLDLLETRTIKILLVSLTTDKLITYGGVTSDVNKLKEKISFIETYLKENPLEQRGF